MPSPAILMIDNVDSFTFMLVDYLRSAGADVTVARNDALSVSDAMRQGRDGIVISPGPGSAESAGISVELAAVCVAERRPFLGVCLGHQGLALACGGVVVRTAPIHGKVGEVSHDGSGLFAGLPSPMAATRYHSLAVEQLPPVLVANAWSIDGTVMGMRHSEAPAHGVQFHPESVASDHGADLVGAFVSLCREGA